MKNDNNLYGPYHPMSPRPRPPLRLLLYIIQNTILVETEIMTVEQALITGSCETLHSTHDVNSTRCAIPQNTQNIM